MDQPHEGVADREKPRRQRDHKNVARRKRGADEKRRQQRASRDPRLDADDCADHASATVAKSGPGAKGGNQSIATDAAPPDADQARATTDATSPTHTTRKYCMTATSLMSPPKASAISTTAVAAPGDEPQTAVVPGSTLQLGEREAEAGREKNDRADQGQEHRPLVEDRQHNVGSDGSGHEAAHKALGDYEGPRRDPEPSLEPRNQDRRRDGAEEKSRWQAHQLESRNEKKRSGEERGPLQGRPSPAESERRHLVPRSGLAARIARALFMRDTRKT